MMVLKRLTTDSPEKNIEVLLNYAYAEEGWVKLRSAGGEEGIDLCEYIEQQRRELDFDCGVFSTDVRDGACMECDCVLAILNIVAVQAAELRCKLKHYEDMEEQGRFFIPPCAIGESVWCISKAKKVVSQYTVAGYLHDGFRWKVRLTKTIPSWVGNKTEHKYVAAKAYSITFFKTREEAENALRGGNDHD